MKRKKALLRWVMLLNFCGFLAGFDSSLARGQSLRIAVPELPNLFSPAAVFSETEKAFADLLFQGLVETGIDGRELQFYQPRLLLRLPTQSGLQLSAPLKPNLQWSDGSPVVLEDVRHTVELLYRGGLAAGWGEVLPVPSGFFGNVWTTSPYQGLFDPLAWWTFPILPARFQGKPLARADDPEFARKPIGTGPYRLQSVENSAVIFQRNPFSRAARGGNVQEIRLETWQGKKDAPPHLVLDADAETVQNLRQQGWKDFRSFLPARVQVLAVNHRHASLKKVELRRFLSLSLDREKLLEDFPAPQETGPRSLRGIFPFQSWANAPIPRVPARLFQSEAAQSYGKKLAGEKIQLSLFFQDGRPWLAQAMTDLCHTWNQRAQEAGLELRVEPSAQTSNALRQALSQRTFDLMVLSLEETTHLPRLWTMFDPRPEAVEPGGSNFLGYDNDARLQGLLREVLRHRQFSARQEAFYQLHVHLVDRLPLIPLWQLPATIAIHPSLRVGEIDPLHPLRAVETWKLKNPEPSK